MPKRNLPPKTPFSVRWREFKLDLREFLITNFLMVIKVGTAILFCVMALLMLTGKLSTNVSKKNSPKNPTGVLGYFSAPPLVKDLRNREFIQALGVEREIVVSQFKLQEGKSVPISIHIQYPCSLTVGLNLDKKKGEWLQFSGDTVVLYMPALEILTPKNQYADNGNKRILLKTGEWSEKEFNELHERAACMMIRQSIALDSCFDAAEANARKQLISIIRSYGYKYGVVHFAKSNRKPPVFAKYPAGAIPNDYNFYTAADGERMIFYKNGSIIYYEANLPFERLYNLAEFCATSFPLPVEISLRNKGKGYTLYLSNPNADVNTSETRDYINYVKFSDDLKASLKKMMSTISKRLFDGVPCNIIETDKNNEEILDYSKL